MSDTWMYSSASGSKLLHSLGFPTAQWFSTCEPGRKLPNSLVAQLINCFLSPLSPDVSHAIASAVTKIAIQAGFYITQVLPDSPKHPCS